MKAIAILGTSSNAGKSWLVTALCAWLRRQGVQVAPFKAQNMSNNSYVTLTGGEIGRAQAVQAAACGIPATVQMNPVLLKPSGNSTSQIVLLGTPQQHIAAKDYYRYVETIWETVRDTLDWWQDNCDVLVLEGAGSPVELNLMHRDIVNLRPILYLGGRWLLVGDIERGGIFAQMVGTYTLLPEAAQKQGLGLIVNKFRGDINLFTDAASYFQHHIRKVPYLGVLPYRHNLQPESEDSLCREAEEKGTGAKLAWIRFPYLSNSQDSQPWQLDRGVRVSWVQNPSDLEDARIIFLPGSKNTLRDLAWLQETGLAAAIQKASQRGVPVVGICGGYQMLGRRLVDATGVAGDAGDVLGLQLLPAVTQFAPTKEVRQVRVTHGSDTWMAYEIHMGNTYLDGEEQNQYNIKTITVAADQHPVGMRSQKVWGTYLHGFLESAAVRRELADLAGISEYQPAAFSWQEFQQRLYQEMADFLETYLDLDPVHRYLDGKI